MKYKICDKCITLVIRSLLAKGNKMNTPIAVLNGLHIFTDIHKMQEPESLKWLPFSFYMLLSKFLFTNKDVIPTV